MRDGRADLHELATVDHPRGADDPFGDGLAQSQRTAHRHDFFTGAENSGPRGERRQASARNLRIARSSELSASRMLTRANRSSEARMTTAEACAGEDVVVCDYHTILAENES